MHEDTLSISVATLTRPPSFPLKTTSPPHAPPPPPVGFVGTTAPAQPALAQPTLQQSALAQSGLATSTRNAAEIVRTSSVVRTASEPGAAETYGIQRCDLIWSPSTVSVGEGFTPVEAVEIQPIIIVACGTERYDDDDLDDKKRGYQVVYRWSRGPARAVCFFHPNRPATLQCSITLRCFCSTKCFARGHVQLRRFYTTGGKCAVPRQPNEFAYGVPCQRQSPGRLQRHRSIDDTHYKLLRQAGLVTETSKEKWVPINSSRNYTPTVDDIGHQLKFECAMISVNQKIDDLSTFWTHMEAQAPADPQQTDTKYRANITGCVIPQAPLAAERRFIPVSILGLLTSPLSSSVTSKPQRYIVPGSPLAEALGIGVVAERGLQKTVRAPRETRSPAVWQQWLARAERQRADIREKRISLLTEHSFANWEPSVDIRVESLPGSSVPGSVSNGPASVSNGPGNGGDTFTVMTWNVLADIYATVEAYPFCDPFTLAWNYRKDRILVELLAYNPDIICLQEVQGDHFEDFFAPALMRRGYEGLYKQKTQRIFRGSGKHKGGKYVCDGCATFFRVPKFRLADHFGIEFKRVAPPSRGQKADKRLAKDNVALVLSLEQMVEGKGVRRVVVANTHILANPEAPDVKIWQANTLTSVLTEYMEKARACGGGIMPGLVLCGDFNSTPDSAVYQLMITGKCDSRHEELQSSDVYRWLYDIPLGHGLNLKSSYGFANYTRRELKRASHHGPSSVPLLINHAQYEPEFTNYTHCYVGCLDYMFFDDRILRVTQTLELCTELQLMEEAHSLQWTDWTLPSPQRPSDHTPLLCRFEWGR